MNRWHILTFFIFLLILGIISIFNLVIDDKKSSPEVVLNTVEAAACGIGDTADMVAYYTFDAGNADDDFNGFNGTITGATLTAGQVGSGFLFNAGTEEIDLGTTIDDTWAGGDLTVSLWAEYQGGVTDTTYMISNRNVNTGGFFFGMIVSTTANLEFFVPNLGTANIDCQTAAVPGLVSGFHHLVAVYSDVNNEVELYVDGVEIVDGTTATTCTQATSAYANSTRTIRIGNDQLTGSRDFPGVIDEVAFFTRALSDAEVLALFNETSGGGNNYCGPEPDITTLTKEVTDLNGGTVVAGDILRYRIEIGNTGTGDETSITVDDTVDPNTELDTGSFSYLDCGTPDDSGSNITTVDINDIDVLAGETCVITYNVTIPSVLDPSTAIENEAIVNPPSLGATNVASPTVFYDSTVPSSSTGTSRRRASNSVSLTKQNIILGCSDSRATNYNPEAKFNNGSCTYEGNFAVKDNTFAQAGVNILSNTQPLLIFENIEDVKKELNIEECSNSLYFTKYLSRGTRDMEVTKWQGYFNSVLDKSIPTTGYFGPITEGAVREFQTQFAEYILTPWNISNSTGYIGKTTRSFANASLGCLEGKITLPTGVYDHSGIEF